MLKEFLYFSYIALDFSGQKSVKKEKLHKTFILLKTEIQFLQISLVKLLITDGLVCKSGHLGNTGVLQHCYCCGQDFSVSCPKIITVFVKGKTKLFHVGKADNVFDT